MTYNDRRKQYNGNGEGSQSKSETPKVPQILSFYEDDKKVVVCKKLFDSVAQEIAKSFKGKNKDKKDIGVTSTQLRRIFDEVKRFEQLLSDKDQFEKQLPYIKMIKSKVAYAVARASKQKQEEKDVYRNLGKFISDCIDLIETKEDYYVFVNLFESVYGFYYGMAPKSCQ